MAQYRQGGNGVFAAVGRIARRGARATERRLLSVLGGPTRTRIIVVLGAVLALSSADTATVGAAATELKTALHITTTDIGLLVAVTAGVGAVFSLPFGILVDRVRRTWLLGFAIVLWGVAMVWSATAGSFGELLLARLALGGVTAVAGPVVASLVGDWFPGGERGQIYSYILSGELLGAGVGFVFTGDIAALSWRLAFVILAIPAFLIAWAVLRLPEPRRGGTGALAPDQGTRPWETARRAQAAHATTSRGARIGDQRTDAQRLAVDRGIRPDLALVARADPRMGFFTAMRYVMSVRTNVVLIVSGACAYYFLAGVQTFGIEFTQHQYHVAPFFASLLLIVVGAGAVVGVLVAGPLGDSLLRRGHLAGRVRVAAVAATFTVVLMVPALVTHSALTALPYVLLAGAALSAQNPPVDAARLDIMPSWLWGRAEGVRTFVRTGAQALAPLIFGAVSDDVFGGATKGGLRWTFVIMLAPLAASAFFLFRAAKRYPRDVATAAAAPPPPSGALSTRVPPGPPSQPGAADVATRPPPPARSPSDTPDPATARAQAPPIPPAPGAPPSIGPGTRWVGGSGPGARDEERDPKPAK